MCSIWKELLLILVIQNNFKVSNISNNEDQPFRNLRYHVGKEKNICLVVYQDASTGQLLYGSINKQFLSEKGYKQKLTEMWA